MGPKIYVQHGLVLWSSIAVALIGVVFFCQGFLLKRTIIEHNSTCSDVQSSTLISSYEGCWMKRRFAKVVLLLVDGLRYDFVACNRTSSPFHHNRFNYPCDLISTHPQRSRLYRFIADPPTTTLQRLQALTTGSLPTFIDAGANFAAGAINEDNWVDQMHSAGNRIVFLGDDTWEWLFPGRFYRSHAFPSFDVRDLDTVDNGIMEYLLPELKARDWNVLIAHFLGVDHCGHRYGANHPAMATKLTQMNNMLQNVIQTISNDTLLILMGDHGMTDHGDHGGDSADEVNSALFAYSSEGFSNLDEDVKVVHQIDLVPTLSLLLGLPIPSGNLGMAITDLFSGPESSTSNVDSNLISSASALQLNTFQVHHYLQRYREKSREFPDDMWSELRHLYNDIESLTQEIQHGRVGGSNATREKLISLRKLCKKYLQTSADMCRLVWAKFDVPLMLLGIIHVVFMIAFGSYVKKTAHSCRYCYFLLSWTTMSLVILLWVWYVQIKVPFIVEVVWSIALWMSLKPQLAIMFLKQNISSFSMIKMVPISVAVIHAGSFLSNSYVIHEALTLNFLLQSLVWFSVLRCVHFILQEGTTSRSATSTRGYNRQMLFVMLLCLFLFSLTARMSFQFQTCREEQTGCQESVFLQSLVFSQEGDSSNGSFRYLLSFVSVIVIPLTLHHWLKKMGNANGTSVTVLSVKYGFLITSIFICYYWALQALPSALLKKLPAWQEVWVPRAAFAIILFIVSTFLISPLCIYVLPKVNPLGRVNTGSSDAIIQSVYQHLKVNWKTCLSTVSKPNVPVVYGLATVYSAGVLIFISALFLLLVLLWGSHVAPGATILIIAALAMLTLQGMNKNIQAVEGNNSCNFESLVTWALMASLFFYGTGHQPTLPSIQWHAAFVGADKGITSIWLPALKILLNTAGSHLLFGLSFPLLLLWPCTLLALKTFSKPKTETDVRGEVSLFEEEDTFLASLYEGALDYSSLCGIKLLGAMVSACFHRRHLMVWKIFAPHFMYEGIFFIFSEAALLIGWMAVIHIHTALDRWFNNLQVSK